MVSRRGQTARPAAAARTPGTKRVAENVNPLRAAAATPRLPQRASGRARFELLVDATDRLLSERDAGSISLYDIADVAAVPAASVYHFFPSPAAAFVALAQRYIAIFHDIVAEPLEHASLTGWQDVFHIKGNQARQFFNEHGVARKLFLGSEYSWQVRQADKESNRDLAQGIAGLYEKHFEIAGAGNLVRQIEIGFGISDTVWSLSCQRHDVITDFYAQEAARAFDAYLGLYLPAILPRRDEALAD